MFSGPGEMVAGACVVPLTICWGLVIPSQRCSLRSALEIKSLYKRVEEGGSELPRWILLIL